MLRQERRFCDEAQPGDVRPRPANSDAFPPPPGCGVTGAEQRQRVASRIGATVAPWGWKSPPWTPSRGSPIRPRARLRSHSEQPPKGGGGRSMAGGPVSEQLEKQLEMQRASFPKCFQITHSGRPSVVGWWGPVPPPHSVGGLESRLPWTFLESVPPGQACLSQWKISVRNNCSH